MTREVAPPLAGRYRLGRLLGVGGMGRVHAARASLLYREVAVKVLGAEDAGDPELASRFRLEA
jgi:serine/threonine protein kinase